MFLNLQKHIDMKGIYSITNKTTNRTYYGSSVDILRRFRTHKYFLRKGEHQNIFLQRIWNKYGESDFKFEIIEEVLDESLLQIREQYYLDNTPCELNLCKTAGNKYGFKHSEETKRKIGMANTGRKCSNETKKYLSELNKNREVSIEVRNKISKGLKGKKRNYSEDFIKKAIDRLRPYMGKGMFKGFKHSEKTKEKISIAKKGIKQSEETKQKIANSLKKKINQYDKNLNFIKTWDSVKEAGEVLNIRRSFISSVLTGAKKSAKGFKFKYYEE